MLTVTRTQNELQLQQQKTQWRFGNNYCKKEINTEINVPKYWNKRPVEERNNLWKSVKIQATARNAVLDRWKYLAAKGEILASSDNIQPSVFSGFFSALQCKLRYLVKSTLALEILESNLSFWKHFSFVSLKREGLFCHVDNIVNIFIVKKNKLVIIFWPYIQHTLSATFQYLY